MKKLIKGMKHIINHFRLWNQWKKVALNSKFFKFMVLIGLANSPSFEFHYKRPSIDARKEAMNNLKKIKREYK